MKGVSCLSSWAGAASERPSAGWSYELVATPTPPQVLHRKEPAFTESDAMQSLQLLEGPAEGSPRRPDEWDRNRYIHLYPPHEEDPNQDQNPVAYEFLGHPESITSGDGNGSSNYANFLPNLAGFY